MAVEIKANIIMQPAFKEKIDWFINNYEEEVSGWIIGKINGEGIVLEDLLIPYQDVNSASVDTTGEALIKLRNEYGDKCKEIIGHWHSHNTMGCFWSATDDEFINQYMQGRDIRIFIVSSKKEGHRIRMEIRSPFFLSVDCMDYLINSKDSEIGKLMQSEISKKVTKKITTIKSYGGSYRGYGNYGGVWDYEGGYYKDYQGKWDKNNWDKGESDEQKVNRLLKMDKERFLVVVKNIYWGYAEEIKSMYMQYNPKVENGYKETTANIIFQLSSKVETKQLYHEIKDYLMGAVNTEEWLSYESFGMEY